MTLKVPFFARVAALGVLGFSLIGAGQFPVAAVAAGQLAAATQTADSGPLSTSLVYSSLDAPQAAADDAAPDADAPRPARLATLVSQTMDTATRVSGDTECLARAVYFESRGEPLEGQLAVAQVILNRLASGKYASTVCGVINQRGQFSFNPAKAPADSRDWRTAKAIAAIAMGDDWTSIAPQATAFHATRVNASWNMRKVSTIGNHVFYR